MSDCSGEIGLRSFASTLHKGRRALSLRLAIEWSAFTSYAVCCKLFGGVISTHLHVRRYDTYTDALVHKDSPMDGTR